ncbi:permease [Mycoplasma feriruminatoris]|uniref:ECF transporter S component n=1 Tax=Mycoplasma feriruminatoris TaxID=1179777 RepID=UPI00241CB4A0|nr:ECF transporter S component [Mycoplasma feriruminatoris]WFQ96364.1 permease [Mycoplasma feriruminatoris]
MITYKEKQDNNFELEKSKKIKKVQSLRQYFLLSTNKVALLATLLALQILLTLFSKYVMGAIVLFASAPYLKLEINYWVSAVVLTATNLFWSLIFTIASVWMRLLLGSEPVGLLSLMIVDSSAIIGFAIVLYIFKKMFIMSNKSEVFAKFEVWFVVLASIIATLFGSLCAYISNSSFIFDLYGVPRPFEAILVITFSFTVIKLTLNHIIFCVVYKRVKVLVKKLVKA